MIFFKKRTPKQFNNPKNNSLEHSYVVKKEHIIWRNADGRGVILNPQNSSPYAVETTMYYSVEGVALRIWELINKGMVVSELIRIIADEYAGNSRSIRRDVLGILDSMKQEGIIELRPREEQNERQERGFKKESQEKI